MNFVLPYFLSLPLSEKTMSSDDRFPRVKPVYLPFVDHWEKNSPFIDASSGSRLSLEMVFSLVVWHRFSQPLTCCCLSTRASLSLFVALSSLDSCCSRVRKQIGDTVKSDRGRVGCREVSVIKKNGGKFHSLVEKKTKKHSMRSQFAGDLASANVFFLQNSANCSTLNKFPTFEKFGI